MKGPVTQEWVHHLPFMQQTVLLTAVRGPDGIAKYHTCKYLLRWYRRCILLSALDGCAITTPYGLGGGSFTGPSLGYVAIEPREKIDWRPDMDALVSQYLQTVDELPHHYQMHFMHAAEIVGYKHPDVEIRAWWRATYVRLIHDMHVWPETEDELDHRLGDTLEGWEARADAATRT